MLAGPIAQVSLGHVLPRPTGPAQEVHLLYAARRHQPLRVRVWVDFLAQRVAKLPGAVRK